MRLSLLCLALGLLLASTSLPPAAGHCCHEDVVVGCNPKDYEKQYAEALCGDCTEPIKAPSDTKRYGYRNCAIDHECDFWACNCKTPCIPYRDGVKRWE